MIPRCHLLLLCEVHSREFTLAQLNATLVFGVCLKVLRVYLHCLGPLVDEICLFLRMKVLLFLKILRIMVDFETLHSIVENGVNVETVKEDDI